MEQPRPLLYPQTQNMQHTYLPYQIAIIAPYWRLYGRYDHRLSSALHPFDRFFRDYSNAQGTEIRNSLEFLSIFFFYLIVLIEELEHDKFIRDGSHLHFDLYISLSEAVLGCSKEVQLVVGKVRIKLESGIQSGKTLRLRGKGLPDLNSYSKGDLLVHINVWTPQTLNREQKQFFQKMDGDENFVPRPEKSDKSFFEKVKDMFS